MRELAGIRLLKDMDKIKVKVFVEKAESGYSAYMNDSPLDYGCIGEGVTVEAAIEDFCAAYEEMKAYYATKGKPFTEAEFDFTMTLQVFWRNMPGYSLLLV